MEFICTYCNKPINCMPVIVDKTHIYHKGCENKDRVGNISLNRMKRLREETVKKWEESGILDGLKGHVKEDIAKLYECCKSSKLE